jgi:hypothetical protein
MSKNLIILSIIILGALLYLGINKWMNSKDNKVIVIRSQEIKTASKKGEAYTRLDALEEGIISTNLKVSPTRDRMNEWETSIPKNAFETQNIRKTKRISFD